MEPAIILNAAFCEHHKKHCSPSQQLEQECAKARTHQPLHLPCNLPFLPSCLTGEVIFS